MAGSPYLRNSSSTHTTTHDCVDSNGSSTSGYFNGFRSSCGSSNQRRLHSASSHNNNDEQRSYQKYNGSTATATTRTPTTSVQANRNSTRGSYYHNQYHNNSPSSAHSSHYNYHYGGAQHNGYTTTSAEKGENSANDSGSNNTNTDISNEITNGNQLNGGGFDSLEQDFPSLSGKETSGLKSRLSAGSTNANGNLFNGTDQYSPKSTCPTNDIDGNSIGSTSLSPSSSIWANAAEKLRSCHLDQNIMISPVHPVKILERSTSSSSTTNTLTRASNLFTPSRILTRKDRLLSVPTNSSSASTTLSNSNGNSTLNNSLNSKPIVLELPTNCITQTKNLDKRSEFFNSLKNSPVTLTDIQQQSASTVNGSGSDLKMNDRLSSNRCSLAANSNSTTNNSQQQQVYENLLNVSVNGTVISSHEDECDINDPNMTSSSSTDLTQMSSISMPEPQEEKELLTRMGWKENDDQTYTITEADKEEFENKKRKLLMKGQEKKYSSKCSAALMKQLRERGLPSLKRTDIIYLEMASEESDDDIYCDNNP
ncbi:unnamed protein product [Didymodactylos carnosus]|uniref:Uncharacterized protein n=1 Tax=Didymodactylos carnosus TaxID=1234261 RepID=A0A814FRU7_9BILA|nr:unnamed protein product [Didymodactylos carnosus]CAF0991438.1 unnamed protein product [Didymodactylos carnosus]CAF3760780.1 unnamed protein product [Didymodactylos carnosus]CAF3761491.1 unnamed protein product [Didymodactylos carnosus]